MHKVMKVRNEKETETEKLWLASAQIAIEV